MKFWEDVEYKICNGWDVEKFIIRGYAEEYARCFQDAAHNFVRSIKAQIRRAEENKKEQLSPPQLLEKTIRYAEWFNMNSGVWDAVWHLARNYGWKFEDFYSAGIFAYLEDPRVGPIWSDVEKIKRLVDEANLS